MDRVVARYDGHAEWYALNFGIYEEDQIALRELLGSGTGQRCLDLACGTGRYASTITNAGFVPVGSDLSYDQLRIARQHIDDLVLTDACALPFATSSLDLVVGTYFHTDVEDLHAVLAEVHRILRPGGRFVYMGLHPAFIGAFVDRSLEGEDDSLTFRPGYGHGSWSNVGSGGGTGLWSRVGGHHKTLEGFLSALIDSGLVLKRLIELSGGGTVLPRNIAVSLTKT